MFLYCICVGNVAGNGIDCYKWHQHLKRLIGASISFSLRAWVLHTTTMPTTRFTSFHVSLWHMCWKCCWKWRQLLQIAPTVTKGKLTSGRDPSEPTCWALVVNLCQSCFLTERKVSRRTASRARSSVTSTGGSWSARRAKPCPCWRGMSRTFCRRLVTCHARILTLRYTNWMGTCPVPARCSMERSTIWGRRRHNLTG